jgi:Zn-finger nucleic acid-binding protein
LAVCEKMLANNAEGKWRVSRGFYVLEASGVCPSCGDNLLVHTKHMVAGFRCPTCKSVHMSKGVLKEVHFRKTKTFDITVTDIPAVPYTGVAAFRDNLSEEFVMKKKDLREKLLAAGISEDVVDARLANLSDEQLKEYDDIPEAEVLKEFEDEQEPASDEQVFVLDEEVLKQFADIVDERVEAKVKEVLDGITFELPDTELELKELPQLDEVLEILKELQEAVDNLTKSEEKRLKEMLDDTPRAGKLRIKRFKATKVEDEEEDDEDMDEEEVEEKHILQEGVIIGADGEVAENMTSFLLGNRR